MPDGTLSPKTPGAARLLREAKARAAAGAPDGAAALYREVLHRWPGNDRAKAALAVIEARPPSLPRGRTEGEETALAALAAASKAGRAAEVVELAAPLLESHPEAAILHAILGVAFTSLGQGERAVASLARARALRPDHAETAYNLGVAFHAMDRRAEAIAAYGVATALDAGNARAWNNMGGVFQAGGDLATALQAFDRAVAADPGLAEARNNRGHARQLLGDIGGAIEDYEAALARAPGDVAVYFNIAHAMKLIGEADAAKTCLGKVLKLDPGEAKAARELAMMVRGGEAAALRPVVEAQLAPANPPATRMHAGYAAAYLDIDAGEDARAIGHLERAGAISKALSGYRIETDAAFFAGLRAAFEAGPAPLETAAPEFSPLFILGMPRSGTSLTEEILARHPQVSGAGELEYLRLAIARSGALSGPPTRDMLDDIRKRYLPALAAHRGGAARYVTDKMPLNFRFVGHILTALPEARIVHLRRSPEAVCWSNYRLHFPATGMAFSATQADVAAFHRLYEGLMAFWEERFPGRIVHVGYEALTETPEAGARTLLDALGLPWEDGVLAVEKSARSVRTASALQVKKGIYTGSSEAWRRFEPWLSDMLAGLGGAPGERARAERARG